MTGSLCRPPATRPPAACRPPRATPSSSADGPTAPYAPSYVSPSDGRRKAAVEDAAPLPAGGEAGGVAPWGLGFQLGERSDALWNDGLKARLIQHVAARDAGLTADAMGAAMARLAVLLPDLAPRLHTLAPALLASLVADPGAVAANVLALRAALPATDVGRMVAARPQLALRPPAPAAVAAAVDAVAATLDTDAATVQRLLSYHPDLLDAAGVAAAVAEGRRVLGAAFDAGAIVADPRALYRFQAHDLLIPYDQYDAESAAATGGDD